MNANRDSLREENSYIIYFLTQWDDKFSPFALIYEILKHIHVRIRSSKFPIAFSYSEPFRNKCIREANYK